jgi:two-component system chemotaxis response regulator CheY
LLRKGNMAKILIIDDSMAIRSKLREALVGAGHTVVEATDGNEGFETLVKITDLDLIISDYNMPGTDGLTMLERARTQVGDKMVPIFMLTTESSERLKEIGKKLGVMAWIVKPFDAQKLLAGIEKALKRAKPPNAV